MLYITLPSAIRYIAPNANMQKLTKELHDYLFKNGYHYLLLKDVQTIAGTQSFRHIVQPVKEVPAILAYTCTSLYDVMILSIIRNHTPHIELYLEGNVKDIK
jgi:hypothetical protein